jgi:hypothetical protein
MAMYNTPFGKSEIPGITRVNAMGEKVYTSGGVYDSKGNPISLTPINNTTLPGWYTTAVTPSTSQNTSSIPVSATVPSVAPSVTPSAGGGVGGVGGIGGVVGGSGAPYYQQAIDTMKGGLDSANAAIANSQKHIASADSDLATARGSAAGITDAITRVNNTAESLSPYADILRNLGVKTSGIGSSILAGDTSGGGLASQYLNALTLAGDAALKINPDRYVSMAAGDVQSSFDNAQGQFQRALSRQGVDAASGAGMSALRRQFTQSLATALAAAKTKARQAGLTDQVNALTQRTSMFKDALATGAALEQQGAENVAKAAGIVQAQGDMFAAAGSLGATQANAFANIGGVEVNLGQLELSNNKLVQDALNNVAEAQQAMGKYYADLEIAQLPTEIKVSGYKGGEYYRETQSTTKG